LIGLEKLLEVSLEFGVSIAGRVYKRRTILRVLLQGGVE
jgi:hypothetical protein